MITERDDGKKFDEERLYLYQLIVNTDLLAACRDLIRPELCSNKYTEYLFRWILEYYDTTGKAPAKDITSIYIKHKDDIDPDESKNIQTLLENLSNDEENFVINNVKHNTDNIINYFNWRALTELQKELKKATDIKDVVYGQSLLVKHKNVERTECDVYDPFQDHDVTADYFEDGGERLFKLPGALGSVLGWFLRGDLVGLVAGQKSGKSWFSIFVQSIAVQLGLKVLFFNLEITDKQFGRRVWQSLNGLPKEAGVHPIPSFTDYGSIEMNEVEVTPEEMVVERAKIKKRAQALKRQMRGSLKVVNIPRGKATLSAMKTKTEQLEKELGFVPDLIVVDNPDVMNHKSRGSNNELKDEEHTWIDLAGWAQELNACIFAPTHGNRDAYGGKKFGIKGLGGSYKKLAHVGKMIQLSMSEKEKKQGYARVKLFEGIERDDGESGGEAIVLHALGLGQWHVDSRFVQDTSLEDE